MSELIPASLDVLKADIATAIARLSVYRRGNKRKAELIVVASAAISAVTTISIGLASLVSSQSTCFQIVALAFSTSLSVLTAWDGLYNHKRLWLLQAGVINALYQVQTDIRHLEASNNVDQAAINELYARYKAAFNEYHSQWNEMRTDEHATAKPATKDKR